MSEDILVHTLFKGRVQGAGFRFTVFKMANEFKLKGTVANLKNGSVEAYIQGSQASIDQLIEAIKLTFEIESIIQNPLSSTRHYDGFIII